MTVWPALFPPWLRTTMSALAVRTSMIFPFPSSPHCAPIKIVFAMKKVRTTNCPDASGWTHSGLRKMIGCAGAAARDFPSLGGSGAPSRDAAISRIDRHYGHRARSARSTRVRDASRQEQEQDHDQEQEVEEKDCQRRSSHPNLRPCAISS